MYEISLKMSFTQDVNVFSMLKLYGIILECHEPTREYHPPLKCPLLYPTSGFGLGWAKLSLQPYGEDSECRQPFPCPCLPTRDVFFLLYCIM